MQTKQNSSENPSAIGTLTQQSDINADGSPFALNPISLIELLDPKQHFAIAWQAYVNSQLLFNVARHKNYENLLYNLFRDLFTSEAFLLLDAETQANQQNMAIALITFLSGAKDLDKKITNKVVRNVQRKYREMQS